MAELYNASGKVIFVTGMDNFDASEFDLIHTFTAFDTDYSTETNTPRVLNIDTETFLDTFYNPYLGNNDNGVFVGKTELGKDESGQFPIWQYEFRPVDKGYKRTILLSSGMHTYELPASFGLARWIKEYMESNEPVFEFLRQNVRILVIPVINPWGFNQNPKKYGNVNGVNPNRNFDTWQKEWATFPVYTPSQNEWNVKGEAPFSEAETAILKEWLLNNTDAAFWIDCHTGLGCTYGDVWCGYSTSNPKLTQIQSATAELKTHISNTYGVNAKEYLEVDYENYIQTRFSTNDVGVPMLIIEQAQGSGTAYKTNPNNSAAAITEYATQIHAYLVAQLK